MQKFSGEGTPPPQPHPSRRLRRLDLRTYGARAQRDTPEKNPSYGLENGHSIDHIQLPITLSFEL